jgi:hypothetical protein
MPPATPAERGQHLLVLNFRLFRRILDCSTDKAGSFSMNLVSSAASGNSECVPKFFLALFSKNDSELVLKASALTRS